MSTESAPPAEGAGTPGGVELFDEEFVDNYEMLTGNTDQYYFSEKMVHHCGFASSLGGVQGRPCVLRRFRHQQVEDYDEGKQGGIVLGALLQHT
jgi:hypothetical protein